MHALEDVQLDTIRGVFTKAYHCDTVLSMELTTLLVQYTGDFVANRLDGLKSRQGRRRRVGGYCFQARSVTVTHTGFELRTPWVEGTASGDRSAGRRLAWDHCSQLLAILRVGGGDGGEKGPGVRV